MLLQRQTEQNRITRGRVLEEVAGDGSGQQVSSLSSLREGMRMQTQEPSGRENRARLYRWERVHAADRQERSGNERTQEQSHRRRTVAAQLA